MGVVSVFFAFFMRVNVASIGKIDEGTCSHIAHQLQPASSTTCYCLLTYTVCPFENLNFTLFEIHLKCQVNSFLKKIVVEMLAKKWVLIESAIPTQYSKKFHCIDL